MLERGIILSLLHYITKHCGESGIISFAEAKSMDFVSNQGSHPFFLHYIAERAGFEPAVRLPVRQFSKLVVLATHPSLRVFKELEGKINKTLDNSKLFQKKKYKFYNLLIRSKVYRFSSIEVFQLRTTIN